MTPAPIDTSKLGPIRIDTQSNVARAAVVRKTFRDIAERARFSDEYKAWEYLARYALDDQLLELTARLRDV